MKQFTDYAKRKTFHGALLQGIKGILMAVMGMTVSVFASHQFELNAGAVVGETDYGNHSFKSGETLLRWWYLGEFSPLEPITFFIDERLDGVPRSTAGMTRTDAVTAATGTLRPAAEKNIRSTHDAAAGVTINAPLALRAAYRNVAFLNQAALPINQKTAAPYYDAVSDPGGWGVVDLYRQMKHDATIFASLPLQRFCLESDITATIQQYQTRSWSWRAESNDYDSLAGIEAGRDMDVWSQFRAAYTFGNELSLGVTANMKSNIAGHALFNHQRYSIYATATHAFPLRNTVVWAAALKWYEGVIMARSGYATGPALYCSVRDVLPLGRTWYVKATADVHAGQYGMLKQYYEMALRKTGRNESAAEAGYFIVAGSLFPRHGAYVRANVRPHPRLNMSSGIKAVFNGPEKNLPLSTFLKAQCIPEVSFILRERLELFTAVDYELFNVKAASGFPSRYALYAGMRSWRP